MVTLAGISRFRITAEEEGFTPYLMANVSWTGFERDLGSTETDPDFARTEFLGKLKRYFEDRGLSTDWDNLEDADDELLINSLSMLCPFEVEDKQALLEAPSLSTRRETLVTLIEFALRRRGRQGDPMTESEPPSDVEPTADTTAADAPRSIAIDRRMLESLVCPVTQGRLEYDSAAGELISRNAHLAFPIRNGIPIMLPDEARELD